jgi:thioesterase domain-containing protein
MQATPATWRALLDANWPGARHMRVLCGGEALPVELSKRLQARVQSVWNVYGPTETTIWSSCLQVGLRTDSRQPFEPIGRPIANTKMYVLDEHGEPVPIGVAGELYIGGVGVARGYLNRPELTVERFVADRFSGDPQARLYRTGDLVRYLPDGNIEFLGRNDHQVKIRGFRIELGEIEARLVEHQSIREAVVIAREDTPGDKRLVAYVVAKDEAKSEAGELAGTLRGHLSGTLPEYMVPAAYVVLDALPLTPNGKLDRKALPAPDEEAYARGAYEAPEGEVETILAGIWQELLGVEQVGRQDSFFELGGHSLLAVKLVSRAPNGGLDLTINDLFQNPVLKDLARKSRGLRSQEERPEAIPVHRTGNAPPIFFLPSGLGDHSYVFELARELDPDIPVYALPWPAADEPLTYTLEAMVVRALSMMRTIQPRGPYRLAGYSSGGMLAYAMAHDILECGEAVSFLGLIDVHLPSDLKSTEAVQEGQRPNIVGADLDVPGAMLREQRAHFEKLVRSYEVPRLPVAVHQFNARTIDAADGEHGWSMTRWRDVLPSSLLHTVPGDHWTMITEPANRAILGRQISAVLQTRQPAPSDNLQEA